MRQEIYRSMSKQELISESKCIKLTGKLHYFTTHLTLLYTVQLSFTRGDLVIFLPAQGALAGAWIPINMDVPHLHFLHVTPDVASSIAFQVLIVARVILLTEKTVHPEVCCRFLTGNLFSDYKD